MRSASINIFNAYSGNYISLPIPTSVFLYFYHMHVGECMFFFFFLGKHIRYKCFYFKVAAEELGF